MDDRPLPGERPVPGQDSRPKPWHEQAFGAEDASYKQAHRELWRDHQMERRKIHHYYRDPRKWEDEKHTKQMFKRMEEHFYRQAGMTGSQGKRWREYDPVSYERTEKRVKELIEREKDDIRKKQRDANLRYEKKRYDYSLKEARRGGTPGEEKKKGFLRRVFGL